MCCGSGRGIVIALCDEGWMGVLLREAGGLLGEGDGKEGSPLYGLSPGAVGQDSIPATSLYTSSQLTIVR